MPTVPYVPLPSDPVPMETDPPVPVPPPPDSVSSPTISAPLPPTAVVSVSRAIVSAPPTPPLVPASAQVPLQFVPVSRPVRSAPPPPPVVPVSVPTVSAPAPPPSISVSRPTVSAPVPPSSVSVSRPSVSAPAPPPPVPVNTVSAPVPLPSCSVPVPTVPTSSASSKSNIVGFEDRNWYRIRNVGDNNVMQVDPIGNKIICMPEDSDQDDLQRFRAVLQETGEYRIGAKFQKSHDVCHVWDYLRHRELLIQRKQSATDKFTQKWVSEHVPGYNSLYLIQSGPSPQSQKCLKNMGLGEQIKLIDKSEDCTGNHFVHWVLEIQDVPNS